MHEIVQGEGGKQGDPLMLALFALGEHAVFVVVQDTLFPSEKLFAFLDDIYAVQNLRRSLKSTLLWGVNCGFMHASTSIKGRRSSGTRAESSHLIAGGFTTQFLWCGREM